MGCLVDEINFTTPDMAHSLFRNPLGENGWSFDTGIRWKGKPHSLQLQQKGITSHVVSIPFSYDDHWFIPGASVGQIMKNSDLV